MKAAKTIKIPDWIKESDADELLSILNRDGQGEHHALLVGGCVRNALLNYGCTDIDIATTVKPEGVIQKLESKNIKVVQTGVNHGTVTAVINNKPYEITTLRKDVLTDGRHAKVDFTDDWLDDAQRRDFTMNALYMDLEGHVFDPTEKGIDDLDHGRVVFVGDPAKRIEEDYLRILRFFRFYAFYGNGEPDTAALEACRNAAAQIDTLSRERITNEFLKMLSASSVPNVLAIMFGAGVLTEFSSGFKKEILQGFVECQEKYDAWNAIARLFVLSGCKTKFYDDLLRLSHTQKNFLVKLEMASNPDFYQNEKQIKKAIFYHGNDLLLQGYLVAVTLGKAEEKHSMIDLLKSWQAPECPVTGDTLLKEGYQTGPELGQELERRQEEWLDTIT